MYALSNENKGNWTGEKLVDREREKTREMREEKEYIYISMSENIEPHIGHIDEERKELKKNWKRLASTERHLLTLTRLKFLNLAVIQKFFL